jgi:hypothetical protein
VRKLVAKLQRLTDLRGIPVPTLAAISLALRRIHVDDPTDTVTDIL